MNTVLWQENLETSAWQISILQPDVGTIEMRTTSSYQKVGIHPSIKPILRPEAESFTKRMLSSDRKLIQSPRQIALDLAAERANFRSPFYSVFRLDSSMDLLAGSYISARKFNISQGNCDSLIGS